MKPKLKKENEVITAYMAKLGRQSWNSRSPEKQKAHIQLLKKTLAKSRRAKKRVGDKSAIAINR